MLELRAHLAEERRIAVSHRSLRVPFALDSQVCLGCLIKGRSSSKQLCCEMKRSLCYALGGDIYGNYMFYPSEFNRADGPTRNRVPDPPDRPLPDWWNDAVNGNFEQMDRWLEKVGAKENQLPFQTLCAFKREELKPNRVVRRKKTMQESVTPEETLTCGAPMLLSKEAVGILQTNP